MQNENNEQFCKQTIKCAAFSYLVKLGEKSELLQASNGANNRMVERKKDEE